ncbi:MAG TPA: CGNR zinc finger domain-containing protein [Gemmatimonadaceae bacterium]|nr:CGNR zinc finger domain-containing protein [Gemmatimonadaceae bacterium]
MSGGGDLAARETVASRARLPGDAATASPVLSLYPFVGERLWLDFVNTDDARRRGRTDALLTFDAFLRWLEAAATLDGERAAVVRRRALQQPAGATAALVDARRVRAALRLLAERGTRLESVRDGALAEINRILGRSAGTRRVERRRDGTFARSFVPVGDAFAGLLIPIVESAADSLILGELARVRRCAADDCTLVFHDASRNGRRRWCDMTTCGNRAKAARFRHRQRDPLDA